MIKCVRLSCICLVFAAVAAPSTEVSAAGLPGLWDVTTTTNISGIQMPSLPPEVLAQMEAAGVQMPNFSQPQVNAHQTCITPEEAARNQVPPPENMEGCEMQNVEIGAQTMTADFVCMGDVDAVGRMEFAYDSDTHYTGQFNFTGTRDGQTMTLNGMVEGDWVSADCGNVAP